MFFIVGLVTVGFGNVAHAINTLPEGYRVLPGVPTIIDTTPIGGDCKSVVTPNDGGSRFVPTKTLSEWNAFKSAAPGLGIALNSCKVDCVGAWSDTSTCSVACGGGTFTQVYTITTPAQNGGIACPYANGATRAGSTSCNIQACPLPETASGYGCGQCPLGVVYHMGGVWDNQFDGCKTWEADGHLVYTGRYHYTQWWSWSWYTYNGWSQGPACYNPWNGLTFQWQMSRIYTSDSIYNYGWLPYRNW
jgi:hypothetical protein